MGYYCTICGEKITGDDIICDACKVSVGEAMSSYKKLVKDYGEQFIGKILKMSGKNFDRLKEFMQISASLNNDTLKKLLVEVAKEREAIESKEKNELKKSEKNKENKDSQKNENSSIKKSKKSKSENEEQELEYEEMIDTEDENYWLEDDEDDPYIKMLKNK